MDAISRRALLRYLTAGSGALGLGGFLDAVAQDADPLAVKKAHHAPRARRVIFLFMPGGPSHVDLFDPKPRLARDQGRPLPPDVAGGAPGALLGSPWDFVRGGSSGIEVSSLYPHLARRMDDLCVIRSLHTDSMAHENACLFMNTGEQTLSRPSVGAWTVYGLGTANRNLPGFVVITPAQPLQGAPYWSSSFLPAAYQGTVVADLRDPIANLEDRKLGREVRRDQLDVLRRLNEEHLGPRADDSRLAARLESFELAFRMQMEAPEAFDVPAESEATRKLYGLDHKATETFGTQCLLARRLIERGVRFVQLYHSTCSHRVSSGAPWDQHFSLKEDLEANCKATDKPIAGLLRDLKARGLLDDTLVIWGGEFGRTPTSQIGFGGGSSVGRDHHAAGFTMWLAGGGVKGGHVHGTTDEFGWNATEDKVHVHDLHATVMHLMGIDHTKLTYRYGGRDYRLTDVHGNVVEKLLA